MPRKRNTAIWPRVTDTSGQYRGGFVPQPSVIPDANKASIQMKNGLNGETSTKKETTEVGSLAELLPRLTSPPPETVAVLTTDSGATLATVTVSVIGG